MPKIISRTHYTPRGRRYLQVFTDCLVEEENQAFDHVSWAGVFHYDPNPIDNAPHVMLQWWNPEWHLSNSDRTLLWHVFVYVWPSDPVNHRPKVETRYWVNVDESRQTFDEPELIGDPQRWTELLSLAQSIAARKAPALSLLGFIEDNMRQPWAALATENPLTLFQSLCPVALDMGLA